MLLLSNQSIAIFHQSIVHQFQVIATFYPIDFQSQVYPIDCYFMVSDCLCIFVDITNRLSRLPIDCLADPMDCLVFPNDFQLKVFPTNCYFISSDCSCILTDITNRLPRLPIDCLAYPIDCLAFPSDCSLCIVTNQLLLLSKRLLAGRYLFSSFHKGKIGRAHV